MVLKKPLFFLYLGSLLDMIYVMYSILFHICVPDEQAHNVVKTLLNLSGVLILVST
jgi:hypothetical protein